MMDGMKNIQALLYGGQTYVLIYSDADYMRALDAVQDWVDEPELDFGTEEADVLSTGILRRVDARIWERLINR